MTWQLEGWDGEGWEPLIYDRNLKRLTKMIGLVAADRKRRGAVVLTGKHWWMWTDGERTTSWRVIRKEVQS